MPGGNQTGPMGRGPRTGRAAGFCAGNETPGYANAPAGPRNVGGGRGFFGGRGRGGRGGGGWRHRHGFASGSEPGPVSKAEELSLLKQQQQSLETELTELKKHIEIIESAK